MIRGRIVLAQLIRDQDAATGGKLVREFDIELNGHALTHFFRMNGEVGENLLLLMFQAREAFGLKYGQPPVSRKCCPAVFPSHQC